MLLGIVVILVSACASAPDVVGVRPGMRPTEVQKILGSPQDRTFQGTQERWVYPHGDAGKVRVVVFDNNRVVKLLNADPNDSAYTLAKNNGKDGAGLCVGKNNYGKFEEGGGCNMYGCWPAGGFCNGFGCTAAGTCSSKGCPKPIESYQCQD